MPMAGPQHLFFDAGHVFIKFDWVQVRAGFGRRAGKTEEQMQQVMAHLGSLGYESGVISTHNFLRELNQQLGTVNNPIEPDEFEQLWNHTFEEDAQMAELFQALRLHYPLHLISNTNEVQRSYLQRKFNYTRHFVTSTFSDDPDVCCRKPAAGIYLTALSRAGVVVAEDGNVSNCLFIDDLPGNVNAACQLGMQGILFTGLDDLVRDLKARGICW